MFGGTMLESSVGTAASAQLFATLPTLKWGCQLFDPLLLKDDSRQSTHRQAITRVLIAG
jgi:muconate cycloisomerase